MVNEIASRAVATALKAEGSLQTAQIATFTGLSKRTIQRVYNRAIERGFDPSVRPLVLQDAFFEDGPRSGRPAKVEAIADAIVKKVQTDRHAREKSSA
jgi:hypothetical protein